MFIENKTKNLIFPFLQSFQMQLTQVKEQQDNFRFKLRKKIRFESTKLQKLRQQELQQYKQKKFYSGQFIELIMCRWGSLLLCGKLNFTNSLFLLHNNSAVGNEFGGKIVRHRKQCFGQNILIYFLSSFLTRLAGVDPSVSSLTSSFNRRPPCSQASGVYQVRSCNTA